MRRWGTIRSPVRYSSAVSAVWSSSWPWPLLWPSGAGPSCMRWGTESSLSLHLARGSAGDVRRARCLSISLLPGCEGIERVERMVYILEIFLGVGLGGFGPRAPPGPFAIDLDFQRPA